MADQRLAELEQALHGVSKADGLDSNRLLSTLYDDLRAIARGVLHREQAGQTLQATALVHEAYIRLIRCSSGWESEAHFMNAAALVMRNIMIDRFKRKKRIIHGGGRTTQPLDLAEPPAAAGADSVDLLELNEAVLALEAHDSRKAHVVSLKFFGGLSEDQIAELLDVTPRTIRRDWTYAKLWLARRMDGRSAESSSGETPEDASD
jgi:RNA polymerase sigma factor (TIGR02999 family)